MVNAEKKHNIAIDAASKSQPDDVNTFRRHILEWYDKNRRVLPWRALPDVVANPYHVWLSEVMLQQTVVNAVIPYFMKFTQAWPTVHDLAHADSDDVMNAWAGLGYYARARNLHKCAKVISSEFDGAFPQAQKELQALPGIGDYTSAAIRAIAFDKPAVVVDGNIERVMARFHSITEPLPASKKMLKQLTAKYAENRADRPGCFSQALMDLGATVCTPKSPKCGLCPLVSDCKGKAAGIAQTLPRKLAKKQKPEKLGYIYWITNENNELLVERRAQNGLLGGMMGLPTSEWQELGSERVVPESPFSFVPDSKKNGVVYHSFTHFDLILECMDVRVKRSEFLVNEQYFWVDIRDLNKKDFPTLFSKCLTMWRETV